MRDTHMSCRGLRAEEAKAQTEEAKVKSAMLVIYALKEYKASKQEIINNLCKLLKFSTREAEDIYNRSEHGDTAMRDVYMSCRGLVAEILAQGEEKFKEAEELRKAKAKIKVAKAEIEEVKMKSATMIINTLKKYKVPKREIINNLCNQLNYSMREAEELYNRSE